MPENTKPENPPADAIYDILVEHAGASPDFNHRFDFARAMKSGAREYRFGGCLGFGGKYRPETNTVDCYSEDETAERRAVIQATNEALRARNGGAS